MRFHDRAEAGRLLAEALEAYRKQPKTVIAALPRGGIVLGRTIADALLLPLDIIVARKIGSPSDPEFAIGAVTEMGETVWREKWRQLIREERLEATVQKETAEARRRMKVYRKHLPERNLKNKTVLLVDDGIATGLTMEAAVRTARQEGAFRIVIAVPVCSVEAAQTLRPLVDALIALETPPDFLSVGNYYQDFPQVDDETVIHALQRDDK